MKPLLIPYLAAGSISLWFILCRVMRLAIDRLDQDPYEPTLAFRYRPGMGEPDRNKLNQIGAKRVSEIAEAQARCRAAERLARKLQQRRREVSDHP